MKSPNKIYGIPEKKPYFYESPEKKLHFYEPQKEKPYAHEPTVGFNAQVSKKPRTLYNQRSNVRFLTEGHRETKPEKKIH